MNLLSPGGEEGEEVPRRKMEVTERDENKKGASVCRKNGQRKPFSVVSALCSIDENGLCRSYGQVTGYQHNLLIRRVV